MAKKRQVETTSPLLTAERATRLCRLVSLLGEGSYTRATLLRRLKLDMRGFYRDMQLLRDLGIEPSLVEGRYVLAGGAEAAYTRLPLPDPQLTVAEAMQLGKGRTAAHQKLKTFLSQILPSE